MVSAPAKPPSAAAKCLPPAVPVAVKHSRPKIAVSADPVEARLAEKRPSTSSGLTDSNNPIEVVRKRPDFLAANRGKRYVTPSFVLLIHKRREDHPIASDSVRYGITVTKKIGNAVARGRMKRRFRALLSALLPQYGISGADHIMIGRGQDKERSFAIMKTELEKGLKHLARRL